MNAFQTEERGKERRFGGAAREWSPQDTAHGLRMVGNEIGEDS